MYFDRAKFGDIVAEFGIPEKGSNRVIIICDGVPTVPSKHTLIKFLVKRGFAVFHLRYRGSWESKGVFLERSPHEDVLALIDALPRGFTGLWEGQSFTLNPNIIYLFGGSFGGAAVLLASSHPKVSKVVAFSPLVDWTKDTEEGESLGRFKEEIFTGYPGAYRSKPEHWNKLESGEFFNPVRHTKEIPGEKILIIHATDDDVVSYEPVAAFAKETKSRLITLKKGGHFGASKAMNWLLWWKVKRFLNT